MRPSTGHMSPSGRILRFAALLFLITVIPLNAGASENPRPDDDLQSGAIILAKVGSQEITAKAFDARYGRYLLKTGQHDGFALRRFYLDYLINIKLIATEARQNGIETDRAYRTKRDFVERKALVDFYANASVLDTLSVQEADLRELFVRMNTRINARHLYAETLAEAERLHDRLKSGESFSSLAREVFRDSVLANNGGSVGTFTFDETDPEFEDAAFKLAVGEISAPIRTAFGYSIIQVQDRFEQPVTTETEYASKKGNLRTFAYKRKKLRALFHLSHSIAQDLNIAFKEATLEKLYDQISGLVLLAEGENFDDWLTAELVTFDAPSTRETWSVADFRSQAALTSRDQRAAVRSVDHLRTFITGLVVREEMIRWAREMHLDEGEAFRAAVDQTMELWIYRRASSDEHESEAELRNRVDALRSEYDVTIRLEVLQRLPSPLASTSGAEQTLVQQNQ